MKRLRDWLRRLWRGTTTDDVAWLDHYINADGLPWDDPESSPLEDIRAYLKAEVERGPVLGSQVRLWGDTAHTCETIDPNCYRCQLNLDEVADQVTDRDLLSDEEKELWEDVEGGPPEHDPIAYPAPAEPDTQSWVTEQLQQRTGGITRHPMDKTQYPTAPTEQDQAAREYVNKEIDSTYGSAPVARGYFTHGYSMQRLSELLAMARNHDPSLTDEELMALRARGLA